MMERDEMSLLSAVNNFDVLKRMCDENYASFNMYSSDTNFISASEGEKGWGSVTIAVDTATILKMVQSGTMFCGLMIYDLGEFNRIKNKIEKGE